MCAIGRGCACAPASLSRRSTSAPPPM
jgi:hypothetical protein